MINVKWTTEEKELLNRFNIRYADNMDFDMAERILDITDEYQSLTDKEQYIADSIVDKITTHPEW